MDAPGVFTPAGKDNGRRRPADHYHNHLLPGRSFSDEVARPAIIVPGECTASLVCYSILNPQRKGGDVLMATKKAPAKKAKKTTKKK
jgi:hypothetical protein